MIDGMAERYSMLPTEVLQKATTVDLVFYYNARLISLREQKKARGESIADTFTKSEISEVYDNFKKQYGTGNEDQ